ncbi:MAG: cistern family PEP-CTERM protein [Gammaproteobacteria bacterium]
MFTTFGRAGTNRASAALIAAAALFLSVGSHAYVLEEELLPGQVGSPPQDAYKITVTLPSDPADDPMLNTFTVNWVVPAEDTSGAPADLTADARFTIKSFDAGSLVMDVELNNTFDPTLGVNSLLSFGFYVDPEITSASVVNHSDPNNIVWMHELSDDLTGNFKNLDICIYPDAQSNSCNGGAVGNGLPAGASDLLTLSLTGNFASAETGEISTVMMSQFPVKFQGDWGSFEVPGQTNCCTRVPEPSALFLALFGIVAVRAARPITLARR